MRPIGQKMTPTHRVRRGGLHDRCGVPLTFGMLLATLSVEIHMNKLVLGLPTLGFVVVTRAALGVGIGLLLSEPNDRA
jgi:hypothetical protein